MSRSANAIELTDGDLRVADVLAVARDGAPVRLARSATEAMRRAARIVERLAASSEPVYGVSTGFGSLATTTIRLPSKVASPANSARSR